MSKIPRDREIELAWAAGFMDGEGHICARGRKDYYTPLFKLSACQVDPQVLHRLKMAIDIGKVYGPTIRKEPQQPIYQFVITGKEAILAYYKLYPYLSPVKQAQGNTALEKVKAHKKLPKRLGKGQLPLDERIYPWPLLA